MDLSSLKWLQKPLQLLQLLVIESNFASTEKSLVFLKSLVIECNDDFH